MDRLSGSIMNARLPFAFQDCATRAGWSTRPWCKRDLLCSYSSDADTKSDKWKGGCGRRGVFAAHELEQMLVKRRLRLATLNIRPSVVGKNPTPDSRREHDRFMHTFCPRPSARSPYLRPSARNPST
eukprot:7283976-Prymnesium_polylepis.1